MGLLGSLCSLLPTNLPLSSCHLQLPVPLSMDLLLTPGEHVLRRDVADCTIQANIVVVLDAALPQTPRMEELLLPPVEDRRLESHFIAQLRDGLFLQQML